MWCEKLPSAGAIHLSFMAHFQQRVAASRPTIRVLSAVETQVARELGRTAPSLLGQRPAGLKRTRRWKRGIRGSSFHPHPPTFSLCFASVTHRAQQLQNHSYTHSQQRQLPQPHSVEYQNPSLAGLVMVTRRQSCHGNAINPIRSQVVYRLRLFRTVWSRRN